MNGIINKIELQGTVCSRTNGKIWVVPSAACSEQQDCSAGCGSCGGKKPQRKIMVETVFADRLLPGAAVIVHSFQLNEAIGALIVFGIPLLCALTVFIVWYAVDPATVESGRALLTAAVAFFCGFIIVRIIDRIFRQRFPSTVFAVETDPALSVLPERINDHG